jgi:cytochrome oxidase Cu insertion factor (SCO1/SenC/PrrC family)
MSLPADLEPVVPDPRKLRRTAWLLVAMMVVGGTLILLAYEKMARKQAQSSRPAMIHQIRKERDLLVIRQDGSTADLFDLRGKVFVVHVLSRSHPDVAARSLETMKSLAGRFAATPDFHLVSLVVDPPPAEQTVQELGALAASHGMALPKWWLATNEARTLHKFIKSELKAGLFPHQEDGRWVFDTSIVLIDRNGNLRRAVVPQTKGGPPYVAAFDFDQAAEWDARRVKTGTELNNQQQLAALLESTILTLLNESPSVP